MGFGFQSGGDFVPYVESVTGLNTNNTNPQNPIVKVSVDGTSITGAGTPASPLVANTGLTIGTTPITSGTVGRVLFEGAGNVAQEDSAFFWDNTNKRLGVGATPASTVRLDIRAQGALSTDIAFRVRNSADTANLFEHRGNGFFDFVNNANTARLRWFNENTFQFRFSGQFNLSNDLGSINISSDSNISLSATSNLTMNQGGCVSIGGAPVGATAGTGVSTLLISNGTVPSANITDRHYYYSADQTAGNAAPHFRTENGSVVKLYKQDLPTNPTNAEIATLLSNLGLANLI